MEAEAQWSVSPHAQSDSAATPRFETPADAVAFKKKSKTLKVVKRHAKSATDANLQQIYDVDMAKIGEGGFGCVRKAICKATCAVRAVKFIPKVNAPDRGVVDREVELMRILDHPNIVKLFEYFEDAEHHYLVMELCRGGELFNRIVEVGHLTETQAAITMKQVIRAVCYMHQNSICHRDLKPENFLLMTLAPIERNILKVIDFGLSRQFEVGQVLRTRTGSPYYVSPQVLAGAYDHRSDLWSVGAIMYCMLCGYPPFSAASDVQVLKKVAEGKFTFPKEDWKDISEDAKELITMLLMVDPDRRYSAVQSLHHHWVEHRAPNANGANLGSGLIDNLRGFLRHSHLKRAALHIIANELNGGDCLASLREQFLALDGNGDGLLTAEEVREGLARCGVKAAPEELQQILEALDPGHTGVIDYTEFIAATLESKAYLVEDACWSAFQRFDTNGDGRLSADELRQALETCKLGHEQVQDVMRDVDDNNDGYIDFDEFMAMMRRPMRK